jgi:ubiquinone/menaquinone biosynthesis C-methylase UbiE
METYECVSFAKVACETWACNRQLEYKQFMLNGIVYDIYHMFSTPDRILEELHRVLKPNAILSFSDHHMKENAILSGVTHNGLFGLSRKGKRTYSFVRKGQ